MKRRTFIQSALASAVATPILLDKVYARASMPLKLLVQLGSTNDNVLVLIQMFGGNDGLNTVVPADDPNYYNIRPNISIDKKSLYNYANTYFNPGLVTGNKRGLAGMFEIGTLAVIEGIGYPNPNLSHFRSTDIWLSGINDSNANDLLSTGWLGRFLEQQYPNFPAQLPTDPIAINFGGFSLGLTSEKGQMGIAVDPTSLPTSGLSVTGDTLDDQATGTRYALEYAFVQDVANRSNVYAQRVKNAYSAGISGLKGTYANNSFAGQMQAVAALIAGGLQARVYFVTIGGFDFHINQVDPTDHSTGAHSNLLGQLADGIAQFQYDIGQMTQANNVIGFTFSEFGRRPHDNNSWGTDHGAASVQFAFGTQINSGVFGHAPDFTNLDGNGDFQWDPQRSIDFRSVYSTLLTDWFGMTLTDAQTVLQDQTSAIVPLSGLIKSASGGVEQSSNAGLSLSVFPNPMAGAATISFDLPVSSFVEMNLTSMDGKSVQTILSRTFSAGSFSVPLSTDLPSGSYLLSLRAGAGRLARVVEIIR
jgi:uncharacterized protein (DUF1501 family)